MPRPLKAPVRLSLALLWLASLLLGGWWLSQRLVLSGDLRKFMPEARTPAQELLLDELGEGPGSRLLLVAISGAEPETLAAQSQALREALSEHKRFAFVANGGEVGLDAIPEHLRPYRYLLSPTLDSGRFDAETLRDELQQRVQDLGSPASALIEPLLPSDPTLETLKLAESWQPANAPQRLYDAWFDAKGREALLAVQTVAPGFDPTGQQDAVDALQSAFAKAKGNSHARMEISGPGAFSVEIGGRTQREASWIGSFDTIGLIVLLLFAYRSWKQPLFGVLPLASAGLAGLGAVAWWFAGGVHGITVAFGFTLIGVVQDYPIHLFSHQRAGVTPWQNARAIWPTLATGVASTCIAYVTFLLSGVDGLQQLAVFTIVGLLTAALTTRLLLPALLDPSPRDPASWPWVERLWRMIERVPRPRLRWWALFAVVAIACIALPRAPFWQNDLSKLTPVPPAALARDAQLRSELGAPDVRYLLAIRGRDVESVLEQSEALRPALDAAIASGNLASYDMAARYLPSAKTQRERQSRIPDAVRAQSALADALQELPFRDDAFAPFLSDLEAARKAPPLRIADLAGTPLAASVSGLLLQHAGDATALVSLAGIRDPQSLAKLAAAHGAELLDLKDASESLVVAYRERVLWALAGAAVLLALTVWLALRAPRRVLRVLLPMALTTLLILAVLRAFGVELTLFHLVALILAAGLGLDYALFFDHAGDDHADQLRTLHALVVCSLTTLLVFLLLALSSIPVLRAIGSTVTIGVVGNFVLGLLIARHDVAAERDG